MIIEPVILEETGNIKFNNSQLTIIKKYIYLVPLLKVGEEMVYYTKNKQRNKQTKNSFGIWRGSGWMGVTPSESFNVCFNGTTRANTHTHTQISRRNTDAHALLASPSSLRRLYCFTADCESCTKWSWWSLYFPSQLTNQFHILFSPCTPTPSIPTIFSLSLFLKA